MTSSTLARKRGVVACDLCRRRKRRCDGKIPCGLCDHSEATCVYPELPSSRDGDAAAGVDADRLARVEAMLDEHAALLRDLKGQVEQAKGARAHDTTSPVSQWSAPSQISHVPAPDEDDMERVLFLIPHKHRTSTTWLLSLPKVRELLGHYPDGYFHSLETNNDLPPALSHNNRTFASAIVIGIDEVDRLVKKYYQSAHQHYPVISHEEFDSVQTRDRQPGDPWLEAAIEQLVCALAMTVAANNASSITEARASHYFLQAMRVVTDQLCWSFIPSIMLCQALILASSYLASIGRPLHSWRYAQSAYSTLQQLLRAENVDINDHNVEDYRRVYWCCFILECDRAAELDLPRSGVEMQADEVLLPRNHVDDDAVTISFVAEISIRRLLNRIHNSLYGNTSEPDGVRLPRLLAIAEELQHQLTTWYESIPASARPSLDKEPCYSDRKAVLRIRYYAAMHIIHRPFVLCIADHPEVDFTGTTTSAYAEKCIFACKTYLLHSTEMLGKRTPYLWTFSASSLGALLVLSIAKTIPALRMLVEDLHSLQVRFLEKVRQWVTPGSSFEAMVRMVETIMSKEEQSLQWSHC